MNSTDHLALFAKFWQPGSVKTRLAKSIGSKLAAQVYFEFLNYLLRQLGGTGDARSIVYSPSDQRNEFEMRWGSHWELVPQVSGDLGQRMRTFFSEMLTVAELDATVPITLEQPVSEPSSTTPSSTTPSSTTPSSSTLNPMLTTNVEANFESTRNLSPSRKVVLIGSDCPLLGSSQIEDAFDCLDRQPVVIGPSTDGGYYLIGMRDKVAEIFDDIEWSTDSVLSQTIQRLTKAQIGFELLPELTDIDEWSDLKQFLIRVARDAEACEQHGPWLANLNSMLADVLADAEDGSASEDLS